MNTSLPNCENGYHTVDMIYLVLRYNRQGLQKEWYRCRVMQFGLYRVFGSSGFPFRPQPGLAASGRRLHSSQD